MGQLNLTTNQIQARLDESYINKGLYTDNPTLNANEYITYQGAEFYAVSPPYTCDSATYPDPNNDTANLRKQERITPDSLGGLTNYQAASVADMVAGNAIDGSVSLALGQRWGVDDYYGGATPSNSGVLFFKVVANGSGTADGGKYIDVPGGLFQLEQNLPINPTVKNWGAKGDENNDDTAACKSMQAYSGHIQLSGLNRVTEGFVIDRYNFSIRGNGMWSDDTQLVIDHDDVIFTHQGSNFSADGFEISDLRVKMATGRTSTTNQHFYAPKTAQAWKTWKNLQVTDVLGLCVAYPGNGVDVYCQRWDIDNILFWRCGAWAGFLGDETVSMPRPLGTICEIGDINLKDMKGHPLASSWMDLRGWRQIQNSNGVLEINNSPESDIYTNITSVIAVKSNAPINLGTIWFEPIPSAATNIDTIVAFGQYPPSAVDGEAGTVVNIKNIESTRQGSDLSGGSSLLRFSENTFYTVHVETVGSVYSYYIEPRYLANFGVPLLQNRNRVKIRDYFWRTESGKPVLPAPLPYNLYGHISIENISTKNDENSMAPNIEFDDSALIYEWYAVRSDVAPDNDGPEGPKTSMMEVDLSVNVDSTAFTFKDGFFCINIQRNAGVPRVRYLVKAPADMIGAWCTIQVDYQNESLDPAGTTPTVISNSNGDAGSVFTFNNNNKNTSGFNTAIFCFQIKQEQTRLDAYFEGNTPTAQNNFFIRSITGRLGNRITLDRLYRSNV